ncbi:MAG: hypothetical protein WB699_16300, partial [Bacteroidota bacterium]
MNARTLLIPAAMLIPALAFSQWHLESAFGTMLDDNTFNNSYQIADRISEATLNAGHLWEGDMSLVDATAAGALNYFALAPSRTFYSLMGTVRAQTLLDAEGGNLLEATAQYGVRNNRDEYTLFDHRQFAASLGGREYVGDSWTIKEAYTFRLATFPSLESLNYAEHTLALQGGTTWSTRTTFIARVEYGIKTYITADSSGLRTSGSGRHSSSLSSPGVSQLVGSLKIAQGITGKTGISLLGQYQGSLAKESRYVSFGEGTVSDDELFDDRYGYDGPLFNLGLTQIAGDDVRLQAAASYQRRLYTLRPALAMDGITVLALQRIDERTAFSLEAIIDLPLGGTTLSLLYEYIVNSSNDPLYTYRNQALS